MLAFLRTLLVRVAAVAAGALATLAMAATASYASGCPSADPRVAVVR